MTPFEEELKKALSRQEPPEIFTRRVLEKVAPNAGHELKPVLFGWWSPACWRALVVLAMVIVLVSGVAYHQHLREMQGQAAKRQLLLAMRIAGTELHEARLRVKRIEFTEVVVQ